MLAGLCRSIPVGCSVRSEKNQWKVVWPGAPVFLGNFNTGDRPGGDFGPERPELEIFSIATYLIEKK